MLSDKHPQLVNELFVSDLKRSVDFYTSLGFILQRSEAHFAVLRWDDTFLFLDEKKDIPRNGSVTMNIRIIVPDADSYWNKIQEMGCAVFQSIDDRYYGLRDFIITDPDGFGLRFASFI